MVVLRRFPIKALLYSMTVLVLTALVALSALVVLRWNEDLAFVEKERIGVASIPAVQAIGVIGAKHRGMANVLLNGDEGEEEKLKAVEADLARAMAELDQKCQRFGRSLGESCAQWVELRTAWNRLITDYRHMLAGASFASHTRLIGALLALQTEMADSSNLILDPVLETYYLTDNMVHPLPTLMESLGQVRGWGSGIAAHKIATPEEKTELTKLAHVVHVSLRNLDWGMGKIFSRLPGLQSRLQPDIAAMQEAVEQLLQEVDRELISPPTIQIRADDFFAEATRVIDRVAGLYDPMVTTLDAELAARAERLARQRDTGLGGAALVLVLTTLLLAYVIRRITQPLGQAIACFGEIGRGNYRHPIEVKYQDELGQVLQSARDMRSRLASYVTQLREAVNSLDEAQRIAFLGNWDWNTERNELRWSAQVYRTYGLNPDAFDVTYEAFLSKVHPEDRQKVVDAIARALRAQAPYDLDHRIVRPDGTVRVVHERAEVVFTGSGEPLRMIGTVQDVTEQRQAETQMRLASQIIEHSGEAILITDADNRITLVNQAFSEITGYRADEVLGRNPRLLSSGRQEPAFYESMWRSILHTGLWQGEIWNSHKNGDIYPEWLTVSTIRDDSGRITHHIGIFSDISERKAAEAQVRHLAHHDPLTDLPNRMLATDRLRQALAKAKRDGGRVALMFIDLDKFKPVNDTFGHHVGDRLLKEVAIRLLDCVRESDTVARLGGDEFLVLLPAIEEDQDAMVVAGKILHALSQPFELADHILHISSSIGIAVYPEHGSDDKMLVKNADAAMYHAKTSGRNTVKPYRPDMPAIGR